jgi:hypothetical protein
MTHQRKYIWPSQKVEKREGKKEAEERGRIGESFKPLIH